MLPLRRGCPTLAATTVEEAAIVKGRSGSPMIILPQILPLTKSWRQESAHFGRWKAMLRVESGEGALWGRWSQGGVEIGQIR